MGIKPIKIEQSLALYKQSRTSFDSKDFFRFTLELNEPEKWEGRVKTLCKISIDWRPTPDDIQQLKAIGYWREIIQQVSDLFIIDSKATLFPIISYSAAFKGYLCTRFPLGDETATIESWQPGQAAINDLHWSGLGKYEINDALQSFKLIKSTIGDTRRDRSKGSRNPLGGRIRRGPLGPVVAHHVNLRAQLT